VSDGDLHGIAGTQRLTFLRTHDPKHNRSLRKGNPRSDIWGGEAGGCNVADSEGADLAATEKNLMDGA
jgi:hypothetical protein